MNIKLVASGMLIYVVATAFMLALHFAISRDGLGNELMLFGFPLLTLFLTGLKSKLQKPTRIDAIAIVAGCLSVSAISLPLHWMFPYILINPYSGPVGVLVTLPTLCVVYLFFGRLLKEPPNPADRDA